MSPIPWIEQIFQLMSAHVAALNLLEPPYVFIRPAVLNYNLTTASICLKNNWVHDSCADCSSHMRLPNWQWRRNRRNAYMAWCKIIGMRGNGLGE